MGQALILHLRDDVLAEIRRQASQSGASPAQLAADVLEREFVGGTHPGAGPLTPDEQAACEQFEQHFGEVDLGRPAGTDNASIDADLAREYASNHEE